MTPEFSRPIRIDTIGDADHDVAIEADAAERAALATRFDLQALDRLNATFRINRTGEIVAATGSVRATATQTCVATGVAMPVALDVPVVLRFVPEAGMAAQEEIELDADACDTIGYQGAAIDLGEAAAESLYLALDPFPRAPNADETLKASGVLGEEEAGPFAGLKALRDKLAG